MPKIPNLIWGAVTNKLPSRGDILQMNKQLPHDGKWHTLFEGPDFVDVDGVTIRRPKDGKRWT